MIRPCDTTDFEVIDKIINGAAQAYKGVIPDDCWKEPYMSKDELAGEIEEGVEFWGFEQNGELVGVMGIQRLKEVTLIRHSYVRAAHQNQGVGEQLLFFLRKLTNLPVLIGTWADASWAIHFYEKHGFRLTTLETKDRLLKKYWSIPPRQTETSVVLSDQRGFDELKLGY